MNGQYDKKLKEIEFYKIHPEYLPFVGDQYDEFKILQVGESHYIPQEKGNEDLFSIAYFKEHWWKENGCEELNTARTSSSDQKQWCGWYNTIGVVADYLSGKRRRGHGIFTEMVKMFSRVYTDTPITSISTENSQAYHHFAVMNFYQMPSLYRGMSYWDSLVKSAKKVYSKELAEKYACEVWEDTVKRSTETLNQVIDILNPQVIIFTSESAYRAYCGQNGKHSARKGVFHCVHPGCKYWHHPAKGQIGKTELEKKWKDYLQGDSL